MIFISGILYILLVILGFFVEIKNFILIAMMLIFAISLFKERELLRNRGSIKTKIISIIFFLENMVTELSTNPNHGLHQFPRNQPKHLYFYALIFFLI